MEPPSASVARDIRDWAEKRRLRLAFGAGESEGSCYPMFDFDGLTYSTFILWTSGRVELPFQYMKSPFFTDERKRELLQRINSVPGIQLSHENVNRRPSFALKDLEDPETRRRFLAVMDGMLEEIRRNQNVTDVRDDDGVIR